MVENQLAKKCSPESCHSDAHTHARTYTHTCILAHVPVKTTLSLSFSASISHSSGLHRCFYSPYKKFALSVSACMCESMSAGTAMIHRLRRKWSFHTAQVVCLHWIVIHLVCVCLYSSILFYVCAAVYFSNTFISIFKDVMQDCILMLQQLTREGKDKMKICMN